MDKYHLEEYDDDQKFNLSPVGGPLDFLSQKGDFELRLKQN